MICQGDSVGRGTGVTQTHMIGPVVGEAVNP